MKRLWPFVLIMVLTMSLGWVVHSLILSKMDLPKFGNGMILTYFLNGLLALFLLTILSLLPEKWKNHLGYFFFAGSGLKLVLYFLIFYPEYKLDGNVNKIEFLSFFVPYFLALGIETWALVHQLNAEK